MNLAIDIGNTRTKIGVFKQDDWVDGYVWKNWTPEDLLTLATNQNVRNVILSNVAGRMEPEMEAELRSRFRFYELSAATPLPIRHQYRTPETLGKDRLAAVVGAFQLYPGVHCLVVDAGTCITYDLLRADGVYLGGNIAPGIRMRLRAMHAFTAQLPLVEPAPELPWLGDSTESALQSGGQLGAVWELEGFFRHCRRHFDPLRLVLTGGDADFLANNLKREIFVNPNLVLIGLNKILNYNVELAE